MVSYMLWSKFVLKNEFLYIKIIDKIKMIKIDKVSISNALRAKIVDQINYDLTENRKHYDLEEYTKEKIIEFIETNRDNIKSLIDKLIEIYEESDELHFLVRPTQDHIFEFYYDYILIPYDV